MKKLRRLLRRVPAQPKPENTAIPQQNNPIPNTTTKEGSSPSPSPHKFTTRQLAFIEEYIKDPKKNAMACVIKAGFSENGAAAAAARLLADVNIAIEITRRMRELAAPSMEKFLIDEENTMQEVASIAFSDIGDFMDAEGHLLNPKDLPRHKRAAVAKFSRDYVRYNSSEKRQVVRETIHFWPKMDALEKIMMRLGLLENAAPMASGVDVLTTILTQISQNNRANRAKVVEGPVIENGEG